MDRWICSRRQLRAPKFAQPELSIAPMRLALALSLILVVSACAAHHPLAAPSPPPTKGQAPPKAQPDLVVMYLPALGVPGIAEFRLRGERWEVSALRRVRSGRAATWLISYKGDDASRLTRAIEHLTVRGAGIAASCPGRGGRDGVTWSVALPKINAVWSLSYRPTAGVRCQLLERRLRELMAAAHLSCDGRICFRPEELATGKWTCADDSAAQCRAANQTFAPPRSPSTSSRRPNTSTPPTDGPVTHYSHPLAERRGL